MYIHRPCVDIDVAAPDQVQKLFAAENPSGTLHQRHQKLELGRPKFQHLLAAVDPVAFRVEADILMLQHHACGGWPHPAQLRARP